MESCLDESLTARKNELVSKDERARRSAKLREIIRPLASAIYEIDAPFRDLEHTLASYERDYGQLDLCPDYQRGHVWTPDQQQHFIENVLRGIVSTAGLQVQFNCPQWDNEDYAGDLPLGLQCIDGLQRITAVRAFLRSEVKPFGLTVSDLTNSEFAITTRPCLRIAIHAFQTRAELLQHYVDINAGGTPHAPGEIERVRMLREEALARASNAPLPGARPAARRRL